MGLWKRLALLAYALACVVGVGALTLAWAQPWTDVALAAYGIDLHVLPVSAVVAACVAVVALSAVVALLRALFSPRPAPRSLHPVGCEGVEVTVRALESSVRAAVEEDGSFLVEEVRGTLRRRSAEARFAVEVIPLIEANVREAARAAQERANAACERLVGVPCAAVTLKVLPATTVTVQKELPDE